MSRADEFFGRNNVDALFNEHPTTSAPFPSSPRRKDVKDYDESKVKEVLENPHDHETTPLDPRTLSRTQPAVTRAGVQHYMGDHEGTYANDGNAGNSRPIVYQHENGTNMILSGHHRATAALLRGEQFDAVVVKGGWGKARGAAA